MTEQQIIDILFFFVRVVVGNVFYFIFLSSLLTPKYNKWATIALESVSTIVIYYTVENINANLTFIIFISLYTLCAVLFHKEKKRYCILAIGIFFITTVITDLLCSTMLLYVYGNYPFKQPLPDWTSVVSQIIADIVLILVFMFVAMIWNKFFKKKDVKSMGMFLLFPLGQTFFIATFAKGTWENNELYVYSEPLLIISIVLSLVADIVMYFALKDNSNMNTMRKRLAEIENEMEQQLKYYDAIAEKYTEIREYRHDILNLVSISEIMLEKKLSESESKAYINEMKKKAEAMEIPIYCNNPLVNAVLWQKQQAAEKSGIAFSTDIEQSEDFPVDRIDICSLMVNLTDNALRECESCEKPFVEIAVSRKINMLFISVKNSCTTLKSGKTRKLATTKSGDHGYGMEIINKIAEKYNGEFALTAENGVASASVMLEVK